MSEARIADRGSREPGVVDSHVHFWDPAVLHYPWLDEAPALQRAFLAADYNSTAAGTPVEQIVFVECNCRPSENIDEVAWVTRLAEQEPRIGAVVAFVDLTDAVARDRALERLADFAIVKGIRHNIQGNAPGFALQPAFIEGVRAVGGHGFTFDLCVTHDQLSEATELVAQAPDTRFVLDHCGKPAIRAGQLEPWCADIGRLARFDHVSCKLSGLLTETDVTGWRPDDFVPYASEVVAAFGQRRVLYGSDWPVLTLAGQYAGWYGFTQEFTRQWSSSERQHFYRDNAIRFYGLRER